MPAWLSMWLPNIMLGAAGVFLLIIARALGRSADSHPAAAVARPAGAATMPAAVRAHRRRTAPDAAAGPRRAARAALRAAAADAARRLHREAVPPHPGHDHRRHARPVLHLDVHRHVGQVVQGPDDARHDRRVPVLVDAGVPVLHHRARGAALGARDGRPADQEQRADRDARVRHQPVSHGAADGGVRAGRQRDPVRHGRARAGHGQSAGRSAEAHHPHRLAADLRRAQSQVDRRQQRRGLSLPVLRSAQSRAEQPVGLRVRSADARAQVAHVRAARDLRSGSTAAGRSAEVGAGSGLEARVRSRRRRSAASRASTTSARASKPPTIS